MNIAFTLILALYGSTKFEAADEKQINSLLNGEWKCTKSFALEQNLVALSEYSLNLNSSSKMGIQKGLMSIQELSPNTRPSLLKFEFEFSFSVNSMEIVFSDISTTYVVIEKNHGFISENSLNSDTDNRTDRAHMIFSDKGDTMKLVYQVGEEATCYKNGSSLDIN